MCGHAELRGSPRTMCAHERSQVPNRKGTAGRIRPLDGGPGLDAGRHGIRGGAHRIAAGARPRSVLPCMRNPRGVQVQVRACAWQWCGAAEALPSFFDHAPGRPPVPDGGARPDVSRCGRCASRTSTCAQSMTCSCPGVFARHGGRARARVDGPPIACTCVLCTGHSGLTAPGRGPGRLGFAESVTGLEECTPNMFLAVVEAILRVQVPDVHREPATLEGRPPFAPPVDCDPPDREHTHAAARLLCTRASVRTCFRPALRVRRRPGVPGKCVRPGPLGAHGSCVPRAATLRRARARVRLRAGGVPVGGFVFAEHEHNMATLVHFLSGVVGSDLSHISHTNICHGMPTGLLLTAHCFPCARVPVRLCMRLRACMGGRVRARGGR